MQYYVDNISAFLFHTANVRDFLPHVYYLNSHIRVKNKINEIINILCLDNHIF